jgi:tetratricopeptide (TPR) repeat protein
VAPISLSDADGQELILEELNVRTAVHGMLSLTELDFRFRNPKPRRVEGRFACTLPANAAISRFAKEVNGQLMEGEVVERLRANQVYEQFLHQMRDPALLEQDQGNRFSARIFPIEANASVQIVLSYTSLLPMRGGVRTYTLPLRGTARIGRFSFRAFVTALEGEEMDGFAKASTASSTSSLLTRSTAEVFSINESDYVPDADVELRWRPAAETSRARVMRSGDFYIASFRPEPRPRATQPPARDGWLFYVDTSASSAEGAEHRVRALERLLASLPANDEVQLRAFDQEIVTIASGRASEVSRNAAKLLRDRLFLGGTDLAALLRDAARASKERPDRNIVIASDLVATVGETDKKTLTDLTQTLHPRTFVHALILGSRQDAPMAKTLTAGRGRIIDIPFSESLDDDARLAANELRTPVGDAYEVSDASSQWVYPTHVVDVQPGDEVLVLGKLKPSVEPAIQLAGLRGGQTTALSARTFAPLLEREAYRAYLDYLSEREAREESDAVRRALASEQVRISIEQRVVIPATTMLVLESEWDYQRFGIDRRSLAAILTVDAGGIGRIDRDGGRDHRELPPPVRPVPMPRPQSKASNAPPVDAQRVEGGVVGGVAGGVVGGTLSGQSGGERVAAVEQTITVTSEAPVMAPADVPPPPPPAQRDATTDAAAARGAVSESITVTQPSRLRRLIRREPEPPKDHEKWTDVERPSRGTIESLQRKLRGEPRDRALYNELSEALAAWREWSELRALAIRWQPYDPENPQVYEVLGIAAGNLGREREAARANGSLIEIAPGKPELLQRAGLLLARDGYARIAEAPLRRALEIRPDRVNGYRHLALMLWLDGRLEESARVLEGATRQQFPAWYGDAQRVVREELGYVYRAWIRKEPARRREIEQRAADYRISLDRTDALRVSLSWETDANDVDLHVVEPSGEECYYRHSLTKSGLELYQDITQGLGPEVIRTQRTERGTYHVGVRYFNAGPMGISRGIVVVMRDDGGREPSIEIHPFRLGEGGGAIRYVAAVKMSGK